MPETLVALRAVVAAAREDEAIAALWQLGTRGVEVGDPTSGGVPLLAWFDARDGLEDAVRAALAPAVTERVAVPAVDWVARFREGFRPIEAGGFLIAPVWAPPEPAEARRVLIVDPGRAFGTGTHETTRLCLAALEEIAGRRPLGDVLDVGTGSGILAIGALRLGAASALGVDHDPDAVRSAAEHARLNGARLQLCLGDGAAPARTARFDTVLANLMAPLLLARRDEIVSRCRPGGSLVLSGLLLDDLPAIRSAYAAAGALGERRDGEWAAVLIEVPR